MIGDMSVEEGLAWESHGKDNDAYDYENQYIIEEYYHCTIEISQRAAVIVERNQSIDFVS